MMSHIPRRVLKAWSCSIFRFLQQAFDSTLLKNHVNFKIKPKLLKMPQIKIKWIILWSKNTPDFLPNILLQYSHTKVGQFYCIFCIINKVKTRIFVFPHFLGHIWFFKLWNNFFEYISLKVFSRQIIRIFDFFSLANDSRYLQSRPLKVLNLVAILVYYVDNCYLD